jgi:MraZ protein
MFRGRSNHIIDNKGRVGIPPRFKELLKAIGDPRLIVTHIEQCLVAYPHKDWLDLEEKLGQLSQVDRDIRSFKRFFVSGACECSLDSQGRILIPPPLRDFAHLEKEVVLVGQLKCFEIWEKNRFEEEFARSLKNLPILEDKLASLGL